MIGEKNTEMQSSDKKKDLLQKIILLIFCIWMFCYLLFFYKGLVPYFKATKWLFAYAAFLIILSFFTKYKIVRTIHSILWIPGTIMLLTAPLVHVIASIFFAYLIIIGVITVSVISSQNWLHYKLEFAAGVYLILTLSSIAATTFSEKLIKSWHYAQDKIYREKSEKYSLLLFSQAKIRYFLFGLYFILLLIFTFSALNHISLINRPNIDIAILQSFATYVAFDRLVTNWNIFMPTKE